MGWFKKAVPPANVGEGDLAEFTVGRNNGRRCIVEELCPISGLIGEKVWHVHPLQLLDGTNDPRNWHPGDVYGSNERHPHAKDRDLRKVPPEDLDKADPRDVEAPKPELEVLSLREELERMA